MGALCFIVAPSPSSAGVTGGSDFASQEYKKWCEKKIGSDSEFCLYATLLIDPVGDGIEEFDVEIAYDPTAWTFLPDRSGFLCAFSDGGDCVEANAAYGTRPVGSIIDPAFGPPVAGSVWTLEEATPGVISLSVMFGSPVEVAADTNMFGFVFEPLSLDLNRSLVASYFADNASGEFRQTSWTCSTESGGACGSSTPIGSSSISTIPLPPAFAMMMGGLLALGWAGRRRA